MRSKLSALGFVLILGALLLSGCAPSTAQPTESPKAAEGEVCWDKDTGARLSYQEAVEIAQSSECLEQGRLKDAHVCNENTGTWWLDLDIDKPGCMPACVVHVADKRAEINWRCTGAILPEATVGAPDPIRARDAALAYLSEHHGEQAPPSGLAWTEERTTPEGLVGSSTFEYTADDWVVTVSFPIVAPENVVYQVVVANQTTGFQWEGEVDAAGRVTETAAPKAAAEAGGDFQPLSPAAYSDLAKAVAQALGVEVAAAEAPFQDYISGKSGTGCQATATGSGLDFESFSSVAQDLKGMLNSRGWQEEISYAADGPTGTASGFRKGDGLCLLNVGWKPTEDAHCPTDQPISACELAPEQQLYTIVLNCAQERSPTSPQATTPVTAAEDEHEEWKTYTSEKFGYTLKYPSNATIMGADPNTAVQFVGPVVGNEHWPWFSVEHYDSDFYRPPASTDVHQWIADSGHPYDEIGPDVEVAGLPTVHLVYEASPQAYGSDHYYFIRGDQLFHIQILHAGGRQDWDLYNKFLQSFRFP